MRVALNIDNIMRTIETRNPDLLAQWLLEQITDHEWTPATYSTLQVWPSFIRDDDAPGGYRPDWIADSRYFDAIVPARDPEEMLKALSERLAHYRKSTGT